MGDRSKSEAGVRSPTPAASGRRCREILRDYSDQLESSRDPVGDQLRDLARALQDLQELVGTSGAVAIAQRAMHLSRRRHPLVGQLELDEQALALLLPAPEQPQPDAGQLREGLENMLVSTVEIAVSLLGEELVRPILERLLRSSG